MKRWKNLGRIQVDLDFGHGHAPRTLAEAGIAEGRTYLQFDPDIVASGPNPSPIWLRFDTGSRRNQATSKVCWVCCTIRFLTAGRD